MQTMLADTNSLYEMLSLPSAAAIQFCLDTSKGQDNVWLLEKLH